MGIFNWGRDPEPDISQLAVDVTKGIENLCTGYRKRYPMKDQHQVLAGVYQIHFMGNLQQTPPDSVVVYSETTMFACLPAPQSDRALALYLLFKANRTVMESMPEWPAEYEQLMFPVFTAIQQNTVAELYAKHNSFHDHEELDVQKTAYESFLAVAADNPEPYKLISLK